MTKCSGDDSFAFKDKDIDDKTVKQLRNDKKYLIIYFRNWIYALTNQAINSIYKALSILIFNNNEQEKRGQVSSRHKLSYISKLQS